MGNSKFLPKDGTKLNQPVLSADMNNAKPPPHSKSRNDTSACGLVDVPIITPMSEIAPEDVDWLWKPYIPLGKVTLVEGHPGIAKTWLFLQLSAYVSSGCPFPGSEERTQDLKEPGNVIYLSAEDGPADTLRPRLDRAGADVKRIHLLTGMIRKNPKTGEEYQQPVSLADLPVIEKALKSLRPVLLVIDPIQAYLGAGVDMHRANEVRPLMAGLAALAEKYKCAVVCIRHLTKASKDRAILRGLGSIDFAAAARSILLVGEDPQDTSRRILAHVKSSLAMKGCSLSFEIRQDESGQGNFYWRGKSDITADALLASPKKGRGKSKLDEAKEFLYKVLADGSKPKKEISEEAKTLGISERSLQRAKDDLPIISDRNTEGNKGKGHWDWRLQAEQDNQESE